MTCSRLSFADFPLTCFLCWVQLCRFSPARCLRVWLTRKISIVECTQMKFFADIKEISFNCCLIKSAKLSESLFFFFLQLKNFYSEKMSKNNYFHCTWCKFIIIASHRCFLSVFFFQRCRKKNPNAIWFSDKNFCVFYLWKKNVWKFSVTHRSRWRRNCTKSGMNW